MFISLYPTPTPAMGPGPHPDYEINHLVPLGIGGSDDDRNLWLEPRRQLEPAWNAEAKARLEYRLRAESRNAGGLKADPWGGCDPAGVFHHDPVIPLP
jgi:hypothetical protein